MPFIAYVHKKFKPAVEEIIQRANNVINSYLAQGYRLTLRQLYYQFIAKDLLPDSWIDERFNAANGLPATTKNTMKNYKRLGDVISDGRLAGLIDWDAIEDRTRNLQTNPHWQSPAAIVDACASQFAIDLWAAQAHYVEVWIEKEALVGVIEGVCRRFDVPYFACKGYTSQSELWGAAQRLRHHERRGQKTFVVHLGDHDPSGIDMTRDIQDRLALFQSEAIVERIALNFDQVENYNPPPNPAKTTDARFAAYEALHGEESWELDALEPATISDLIETAVEAHINDTEWQRSHLRQQRGRGELQKVADRWEEIVETL